MDSTKHPNSPPKLPRMSTAHYVPKVGDTITVEIPDERTRAEIVRVISDTAVIARLLTFLVSKTHNYRKDELVPCRFGQLDMTVPGWKAISERELADMQPAEEPKGKKAKTK